MKLDQIFLVVVSYFLIVIEKSPKVEKKFSWFPTKFNVLFQNMKKIFFFDRNYKLWYCALSTKLNISIEHTEIPRKKLKIFDSFWGFGQEPKFLSYFINFY